MNEHLIIEKTDKWLVDVVIGLNLCPFAAKPYKNNQIHYQVSGAKNHQQLLDKLNEAFTLLENNSADKIDTILFIEPKLLNDFYDYLDFLDVLEALIDDKNWQGKYQIASFHPNYCFAGVAPNAKENLTNRAPYPIFHLLREDSMSKAVDHYPEPEAIPERNIEVMNNLTAEDIKRLFPYLKP